MSKIVSRVAAVAALALAATPIIGLTAAHAAESQQVVSRIPVGDLRLSNPADAREFTRRAQLAAKRACGDQSLRGLSLRACLMDFNEDLQAALSEKQVSDLVIAQRAGADIKLAAN